LKGYAEHSTTHGIAYVFEEKQTLIERIIWFFVVSACVFAAIYLSLDAYQEWQVRKK